MVPVYVFVYIFDNLPVKISVQIFVVALHNIGFNVEECKKPQSNKNESFCSLDHCMWLYP